MKKKLFPILGLVLAAALLFGLWYAAKPEAQTGSKALTVEVIHGNPLPMPWWSRRSWKTTRVLMVSTSSPPMGRL